MFDIQKTTVVLLLFIYKDLKLLLAVIWRFRTVLFSLSACLWHFRLWSWRGYCQFIIQFSRNVINIILKLV